MIPSTETYTRRLVVAYVAALSGQPAASAAIGASAAAGAVGTADMPSTQPGTAPTVYNAGRVHCRCSNLLTTHVHQHTHLHPQLAVAADVAHAAALACKRAAPCSGRS
jgi:hypothetical protein